MLFWTLVIFCFSKTSIRVKRIQIVTTFSTDARCNNTKQNPKMPCRLLTFRQLYKRKWVPSSHGNRKQFCSTREHHLLIYGKWWTVFSQRWGKREGQRWPNKPFTPASLEWTCYRVIMDRWPENTVFYLFIIIIALFKFLPKTTTSQQTAFVTNTNLLHAGDSRWSVS